MFWRINQILILRLAISDFTKTLLSSHTWSVIWLPTSLREGMCYFLSDWNSSASLVIIMVHILFFLRPLATFLSLLLKHASPNTSSTCILQSAPTWQRRKGGQSTDQATLDQSAFMPLRVWFTVWLPTCLSVSRKFAVYIILKRLPGGKTAHITPGYRRTHARFVSFFQSLCWGTYVRCTTSSDTADPQYTLSAAGYSCKKLTSSELCQ